MVGNVEHRLGCELDAPLGSPMDPEIREKDISGGGGEGREPPDGFAELLQALGDDAGL